MNRYYPANSGELNQPCILRENQTVRDEGGGEGDQMWVDLVNPLWCKVTPVKSDETIRGGGRQDVRTALFCFRLDEYPAVSIKHLIVWNNKEYYIQGIKETGSEGVFVLVEGVFGINR